MNPLTYPGVWDPEPTPCIACGDFARHMDDGYCTRCSRDLHPSTVGPQ